MGCFRADITATPRSTQEKQTFDVLQVANTNRLRHISSNTNTSCFFTSNEV